MSTSNLPPPMGYVSEALAKRLQDALRRDQPTLEIADHELNEGTRAIIVADVGRWRVTRSRSDLREATYIGPDS